jgi:hypothetical protein
MQRLSKLTKQCTFENIERLRQNIFSLNLINTMQKCIWFSAFLCLFFSCKIERDYAALDELHGKQYIRKGLILNPQQWNNILRQLSTQKETFDTTGLQGGFELVEIPAIGGMISFASINPPDKLVNPEKYLVTKSDTKILIIPIPYKGSSVLACKDKACVVGYEFVGTNNTIGLICEKKLKKCDCNCSKPIIYKKDGKTLTRCFCL